MLYLYQLNLMVIIKLPLGLGKSGHYLFLGVLSVLEHSVTVLYIYIYIYCYEIVSLKNNMHHNVGVW